MTTTQPTAPADQAEAALQRVRDYINRAAGQHSRAIGKQFAAARYQAQMRAAAAVKPATPWSTTP